MMLPERILPIDDPRLRQPSVPVMAIDQGTRALVAHMFRVMDAANGAGLAAVQIGILKRLIVMAVVDAAGQRHRLALANPEIIEASSVQVSGSEGCLSMPGAAQRVGRAETVMVTYMDMDGQPALVSADGMFAVCLQHEIDHINGIVFTDRMSRLRRDQARRQYSGTRRLAVSQEGSPR